MDDPIYLASDHRGYALKQALRRRLEASGLDVCDLGTHGTESVDYPEFAAPAARAVSTGAASRAIVICGTGLGVMYTANRFPGVRAALVHDVETSVKAREHNDANVLALAGDTTDPETAWAIVEAWLATPFAGGRHVRRVAGIDELTRGESGALSLADPQVAELLRREARRKAAHLALIPSVNFVSEAVREVMGSAPEGECAEGDPGRRCSAGRELAEAVEYLAIERARELFGAAYVNVEPRSGFEAAECVYRAVLEAGDTVLAMDLDQGGDGTGGIPSSLSGMLGRVVSYGVSRGSERIDYDQVRALALEHRPRLIQCGGGGYSRVIDFDRFREIADQAGALLFAEIGEIAGLVASGLHPSPVGRAQLVGGATCGTLRGPPGGLILCDAPFAARIEGAVSAGLRRGPSMRAIAAKAVAFREALEPGFRGYCEKTVANARALARSLEEQGVRIASGGTDNHLLLLSLVGCELTGKGAEIALERAGISARASRVPFDPREPAVTSGLRIGTPAVTTRGMGEAEMAEIAGAITRVLEKPEDQETLAAVRREVEALCSRFPLPPGRLAGAG
jgi:glycine hydroxymethyltransferase